MRTIVAYPGTMAHARHSALAIWEAGCLDAFVTTFAWRQDNALGKLLTRIPGRHAKGALRQFSRRSIAELPPDRVRSYATWEILRVMAARLGAGTIIVDRIWDRMSHDFDDAVARHVPATAAVVAFEYTARAAFETARRHGVARILQLPSRDSKETWAIEQREQQRWPALTTPQAPYFAARFARRYARRQQEIATADLVVANSTLTARSHIMAGADANRVVAVPLAAPFALDATAIITPSRDNPLSVLWAGSFNIMKGAPYLLEAWRLLNAGPAARLDVYGQNQLPVDGMRALAGNLDEIVFHGSVPQDQLFEAYARADVLVVPTLADGFGMVVLEAMAHGVPVIVTDEAGVAEVITSDNGLIVPAADSRALADALRWSLDNRRRLSAMRYFALETARGRLWPDYRRDLVAALQNGLARAGYRPTYGRLP